jgi:hypothetical protein
MMLLDTVKEFMLTEQRMKELRDYVIPVKKTIVMPRSKAAPPPVDQPMPVLEVCGQEIEIETEPKNEKDTQDTQDTQYIVEAKPTLFDMLKPPEPAAQSMENDKDITAGLFFPREKDQLFWCFYIMKHGIEQYRDLGKINIVIEKKIKIEYIEVMRTKKVELKQNKMAPLAHIEDSLLNEFKIDLKTFLALCVCDGLPVTYLHKKMYYELELDDGEASTNETKVANIIARFDEPLRYGCKTGKEINVKSLYKIDNLNKPIKAISAYKMEDLLDMCHKLGINMGIKKQIKKDLYEQIVQELGV